jgi:hypothetical protein
MPAICTALKIEWSHVLIENLNHECASFIKGKPYHVSFERDVEKRCCRFNVGFTRKIPPQIPMLMSDICGNLLASLDYAWMGVIRKENPTQAEKRTLPIADNRKGLKSTIRNTPIQTAIKEAEILLVDRIKSHRDFTDGGNKAIAAFNGLSNWNKHNLLMVAGGVTAIPGLIANSSTMRDYRISDIKIYGGVCSPISIDGSDCEITYDGDPTVDIVFGKHELVWNEPVVPTLRNLAQTSLEALHAFCETFPDPRNPVIG